MGALDGNQSCLALTFDDGPDESWTDQVLDILKAYGVFATFFCIGEQVQAHTGVLRRMREEGHVVANHTWSHPRLTQISNEDLADEIERTSDVIESAINLRPRLFRPPYGDLDALPYIIEASRALGYDFCTVDTLCGYFAYQS